MGDTKIALLGAAERLFSERGYASVGIRDIADEAGANLASINYYFGSKRALYLEMVRTVMARGGSEAPWSHLDRVPGDRLEAAVALVAFIRSYLERLFDVHGQRSCGALMLWEAVQPSDAIDAVVRDYVRPAHEALAAFIVQLLDESDRKDADLFARSTLSLVHHYYVFRPFIERLGADDPSCAVDADRAGAHVARYALRGIGCDDAFIDAVMTRAASPTSATADPTLTEEPTR